MPAGRRPRLGVAGPLVCLPVTARRCCRHRTRVAEIPFVEAERQQPAVLSLGPGPRNQATKGMPRTLAGSANQTSGGTICASRESVRKQPMPLACSMPRTSSPTLTNDALAQAPAGKAFAPRLSQPAVSQQLGASSSRRRFCCRCQSDQAAAHCEFAGKVPLRPRCSANLETCPRWNSEDLNKRKLADTASQAWHTAKRTCTSGRDSNHSKYPWRRQGRRRSRC